MNSPIYDPKKTFLENYEQGPFGDYADGKIFVQQGEPQNTFLGQQVYLPFGTAACPIGLTPRSIKSAFEHGYDIVTFKTVRSGEYPTHPMPNILGVHLEGSYTLATSESGLLANDTYTEPLAVANSFGVGSFNPDIWQKEMHNAVLSAGKGQFLIGSTQGTLPQSKRINEYIDDFVTVAKLAKETGVKVIETNFSCPNEGTTDLLCFDVERMKIIVEKIKNEIGNTPYLVKIAYFSDKKLLRQLIENIGSVVDGISAINTISTKFYNEKGEQAFPGEGRLRSGLSGYPIKGAGLEMVQELKSLREELGMKYQILGIGGVLKPEDYFEYKKAGADAVMAATGAMWNAYLAKEIKSLH